MHPLDRLLLQTPPEADRELRAWRMPECANDDPTAQYLARALIRPRDSVLAAIARDLPAFFDAYGLADTPEIRRAWTRPLETWLEGASIRLSEPEELFFIQWRGGGPDGAPILNRLEAVVLTNELAVVLFHVGLPHHHVPFVAGLITREAASRSLALLLSRMETVLMSPGQLRAELDSNLPWHELVRSAFAGAQLEVPEVLHMSQDALEFLYVREVISVPANGGARRSGER